MTSSERPNDDSRVSEESLLKKALSGDIPAHVGIIMDGNGRWATSRGMPRNEGHRRGVESIRRCLPALLNLGIKYCTFYVLHRELEEAERRDPVLMNLIVEYAKEDRSDFAARH